jgi:two-component system, OmpR family, sensor histidine kinase BaeS
MNIFRRHIGFRLFFSYFLVTFIGLLALALSIQVFAPSAYRRHMNMMAGQSPMMEGHSPGEPYNQETFLNFRAGVNEALLFGVVIAFFVAMIASIIFSRRIIIPVQQLMNASQKIAEGNYRETVKVRQNDETKSDELDHLAMSFNRMAEQLDHIEQRRIALLGDVAHELRTPLSVIKGNLEGLIDGVIPSDVETFQLIANETRRLERLVNDLQELSRVEAGAYHFEMKTIPAKQLLQTLFTRLGRQFEEKGVELNIQFPVDDLNVLADEERIGQVLTNLVGNALLYTPVGGKVSISTFLKKNDLLFSILDTGIGISPQHLPYIFDRFYRVDKSRSRSRGGSGIGSTIAKHFVEAHGGKIWAESRGEGMGTTITFSLPVAKDKNDPIPLS